MQKKNNFNLGNRESVTQTLCVCAADWASFGCQAESIRCVFCVQCIPFDEFRSKFHWNECQQRTHGVNHIWLSLASVYVELGASDVLAVERTEIGKKNFLSLSLSLVQFKFGSVEHGKHVINNPEQTQTRTREKLVTIRSAA